MEGLLHDLQHNYSKISDSQAIQFAQNNHVTQITYLLAGNVPTAPYSIILTGAQPTVRRNRYTSVRSNTISSNSSKKTSKIVYLFVCNQIHGVYCNSSPFGCACAE